jgi:D-alanyl-D-alanine carboxypeptidase
MADKKISELSLVAASDLDGTEVIAIVHSSETKKTTISNLENLIVTHLTATNLTVVSGGGSIDLDDSAYDNAEMIKLSWSGASDTIEITLPDATATKNLNRQIRLITDSSYTTNTHADLTPISGQTLDGSSSHYRINKAYEGITVWCDGTEWFIIQAKAS